MAWSEDLVRASYRGVAFDVRATGDSIERRVVEHEYLYRDGADLEDTGRKARPTQLTAVFQGIDYLQSLQSLMRVCDEGATGPLQHPVFGTWQAKAIRLAVTHEDTRRNFAAVEIDFREDGVSNSAIDAASIGGAVDALSTSVDELQTSYDELDMTLPAVPALITDATSYQTDVEDSSEDLGARFDQLLQASDAVHTALSDVLAATAWPVAAAARDVLHRARELKGTLERIYPQVVEMTVAADVPVRVLALRLYGDPDRGDSLLRINRIRQPSIVPAGTRLRVYAK